MSLLSPNPRTSSTIQEDDDSKKRKLSSLSINYDTDDNRVNSRKQLFSNDIMEPFDSTLLSLKNHEEIITNDNIVENEHCHNITNDNDCEAITSIIQNNDKGESIELLDEGHTNNNDNDKILSTKNGDYYTEPSVIHQMKTIVELPSNESNQLAVAIDNNDDDDDTSNDEDEESQSWEDSAEEDDCGLSVNEDDNSKNNANGIDAVQEVSEFDTIMDETSKLIGEAETCLDEMRMIQVKNAILMDSLVMVGA